MKQRLPLNLSALLLAVLAVLTVLPTVASAQSAPEAKSSPYIKLVSSDGTAIEAEILSATTDTVHIMRRDRQKFSFPLSMLNEQSQKTVREWALDKAFADSLEVRVRERVLDRKKGSTDSRTSDTQTKELQFIIVNKSDLPIDNLRMEYRFYCSLNRLGYKDAQEVEQSGEFKYPLIQPRSESIQQSPPYDLMEEKLKSNWYIGGGENTKRTSKDTMDGYWYRLYRGKNLIMEDSRPKRLMQIKTW